MPAHDAICIMREVQIPKFLLVLVCQGLTAIFDPEKFARPLRVNFAHLETVQILDAEDDPMTAPTATPAPTLHLWARWPREKRWHRIMAGSAAEVAAEHDRLVMERWQDFFETPNANDNPNVRNFR